MSVKTCKDKRKEKKKTGTELKLVYDTREQVTLGLLFLQNIVISPYTYFLAVISRATPVWRTQWTVNLTQPSYHADIDQFLQ